MATSTKNTKPSLDGSHDKVGLSTAEQAEFDQLAASATDSSSLYISGEPPRGRFAFLKKRSAKIAVIGIVLAILGYTGFLFLARPLEMVHWSKNLEAFHFSSNEEVVDSRLTRAIRYLRYRDAPERRRMSAVANKWTDKYVARFENELGIKLEFEGGTLKRMRIVDEEKARRNGVLEELEANDFKVSGDVVDISPSFFDNTTRLANKILVRSLDLSKTGSAIVKRALNIRTGTPLFHLFFKKKPGESYDDYIKRIREDWRTVMKGESADLKITHKDESPDDEPTEGEAEAQESADAVQELTPTDPNADPTTKINDVKSKIKSAASKGPIILGILCAIYALDKTSDELDYLQKQLPMMRIGTSIIAGGNQIMSGHDLEIDGVGEIVDRFYDEGAKASFKDSRSIQYELGQEPTGPDIPDSAKLERTTASNIVSGIAGFPGLGLVCKAVSSIIGQIFFFIISPIEELVETLLFDRIIGFALDTIANILAGEPVNVDSQGAVLGGLANWGTRLSANDVEFAFGAVELDSTDETNLRAHLFNIRQIELAEMNWAERLLDPSNPQSLLSEASVAVPKPNELMALIKPQRLMGLISSPQSLLNIFGRTARAQASYQYSFPKVSYRVEELEDTKFENPYENANWIETVWDSGVIDFNTEYGEPCFGVTVSETGQLSFTDAKRFDKVEGTYFNEEDGASPAKCNPKPTDPDWEKVTRFRFFLADMMTQTSMACYEGDEKSCISLGISEGAVADETSDEIVGCEGSTSQDLAQQILDTSNISFDSGAEVPFEEVAAGEQASVSALGTKTDVSVNLLCIILTMATDEAIPLRISALTTGTHADGSLHYSGRGVDIGNEEVADQVMSYLYDNRDSLDIHELIFSPPPEGTENLDSGEPHTYSQDVLDAHTNHIHFSVN